MNLLSKLAMACIVISMTAFAQGAFAISYCTIDSSFDGLFGGRGWTELEAKTNARQA